MVDKPLFEFHPESFGSAGWGIPVNVPDKPTMGLYLCSGPTKPPGQETDCNQYCAFNFTGPPGTAAAIYYALCFQFGKWGFNLEKPDEWIEVSPTHKAYYETTMATKQMLEGVIKTGLGSAAATVGEYELLAHDVRKYKEVLNYFKTKDEHSLKAMFIDQVDAHTGEVSMRAWAPKWPTLIADFMRLGDEVEIDAIQKKYEVSRAEAVVLSTKNRLYREWKKIFLEAATSRYELLSGLLASRKKSIEEYRNWLRPHIARFKAIRLGAAVRPRIALTTFADVTGMSSFSNGIRLWAWKFLKPLEPRKAVAELKAGQDFIINPWDDYVRSRFVLDERFGLAKEYPWLRDPRKYCASCKEYMPADAVKCKKCGGLGLEDKVLADEIVEKKILEMWKKQQKGLLPAELYYVFMDIDIFRCGTKLPVGELEDITFNIRNFVVSQNILLVKLLELECREREFERYIDEILGVRLREEEITALVRREYPELFGPAPKPAPLEAFLKGLRAAIGTWTRPLAKLRLPAVPPERRLLMWVKPGPYEREFFERITKQYLTPAGAMFGAVEGFLKEKAGMP